MTRYYQQPLFPPKPLYISQQEHLFLSRKVETNRLCSKGEKLEALWILVRLLEK